jgi:hypothetical protein
MLGLRFASTVKMERKNGRNKDTERERERYRETEKK